MDCPRAQPTQSHTCSYSICIFLPLNPSPWPVLRLGTEVGSHSGIARLVWHGKYGPILPELSPSQQPFCVCVTGTPCSALGLWQLLVSEQGKAQTSKHAAPPPEEM